MQIPGGYQLNVEVQRGGSTRLTRIDANAVSGTAAQSAAALANTGQSITLRGAGLLANDRVVFTTIDSNGNLADRFVGPTAVDLVNGTLSVVVPEDATTGRVRLDRDRVGLMLQIVPTLTDVAIQVNSVFTGGNLTLSGSGFAEGAGAGVLFGSRRVDDISRNQGINVFDFLLLQAPGTIG